MKFKTIFIIFNVVIIFSFLIIFFMPLLILGFEYSSVFWTKNWFLPLLFAGVLILLNTYFIINWKMFRYLEKEDWASLITLLEDKIFTHHKFVNQQIRVLINAYLVQSDLESIQRLEKLLEEKAEKKISANVLQFGIPYLLKNKPVEMEMFFRKHRDDGGGTGGIWVRWNYAFSLLLNKKKEEAKNLLIKLQKELFRGRKEPVLLLLCLYLLAAYSEEDRGIQNIVDESSAKLKNRYSPAEWERVMERSKTNIEVVILSKLVSEAGEWLQNYNGQHKESSTDENI